MEHKMNHSDQITKHRESLKILYSSSDLSQLLVIVRNEYDSLFDKSNEPEYSERLDYEYVDLMKTIQKKIDKVERIEVIHSIKKIITRAKELAKKEFFSEQLKIDISLRLKPGKEKQTIDNMMVNLNNRMLESNSWNIENEHSLQARIMERLKGNENLTKTQAEVVKSAITKMITTQLKDQYLTKETINFLKIFTERSSRQKRAVSTIPSIKNLKATNWHKALLFYMDYILSAKVYDKEEIVNKMAQKYGCANGDSFYTEFTRIQKYKTKLEDYIFIHHSNPRIISTYKIIIRSLPNYTRKIETLLSKLPENTISK